MNKATASDVIACPGCDAARASATRCVADPGPPQIAAVPGLQRTTSCCAAHGTRAPRRTAASCKEPTFACGRLRSIVSGLLFTMKTATRACDRSAGSAPLVQHPLVPAKAGPRNPDQSWLWIPAGVYPRESGGGNERSSWRALAICSAQHCGANAQPHGYFTTARRGFHKRKAAGWGPGGSRTSAIVSGGWECDRRR